METSEAIRNIKHLFMTYRNGIISDSLRKAGMDYKIIFGLQLPQLSAIAREIGVSTPLARTLWEDSSVRESRLLACYLFDALEITQEEALALGRSVQTREEADILCFRLLKKLPFAPELALLLSASESPLPAYCGEALRRNLDALETLRDQPTCH